MTTPKVSIIIPCFNYGRYLSEAVDSALGQTYQNIEVIVVNDGSTDNTEEVALRYGSKIRYLGQENKGVVVTMNRGINGSTGEYVCVLSADDKMHEDFISKLIKPLVSSNDSKLAFSYCDMKMFGSVEKSFKAHPFSSYSELYRNYILASALIRKSAFQKVGGFQEYMNGKFGFEDWDLWIRLIGSGYKGIYVPGTYFYYRIQPASRNVEGAKNTEALVKEIRKHNRNIYSRVDVRVYIFLRHSLERVVNRVRKHLLKLEPWYPV